MSRTKNETRCSCGICKDPIATAAKHRALRERQAAQVVREPEAEYGQPDCWCGQLVCACHELEAMECHCWDDGDTSWVCHACSAVLGAGEPLKVALWELARVA